MSSEDNRRREAAELLAATGSRYHRVRQHNGRGYTIIRQDAIGSTSATVLDVDLSDDEARVALAAYRREEAAGCD